jgi:hypothetical protein
VKKQRKQKEEFVNARKVNVFVRDDEGWVGGIWLRGELN